MRILRLLVCCVALGVCFFFESFSEEGLRARQMPDLVEQKVGGNPLMEFKNFTMLTIPRSAGDVRIDHLPTKALIEFHFTEPVPFELRKKLERKIRLGRNPIEAMWRSRTFFKIRLRSMASAVHINEEGVDDGVLIFVGEKHAISAPARHIFKEGCPKLFTLFEAADDDDIFKRYCHGVTVKEYRNKNKAKDYDAPARRNVLRLLKFMEQTTELTSSPGAITRRVSASTMSPAVNEFAKFTVSMIYALRDEHVKTLQELNRLQKYHNKYKKRQSLTVFKKPQMELVNKLGYGTFERYLKTIFSKGKESWAKAISQFERFDKWEGPNFDFFLKWKIAKLYRRMLMPNKAIEQYLEMLERDVGYEPIKLEELVETYIEANKPYRAYSTYNYLMERYPSYDIEPTIRRKIQRRARGEIE